MKLQNKKYLCTIPITGIIVSILVSYTTLYYEMEKQKIFFENQSSLIFNNIQSIFNNLDIINKNIALLFNSVDFISENQFNLFTQPTLTRYPFIENIYYIPRIEQKNIKLVEQQKRNEGYTGFKFRTFSKKNYSPSPITKYLFPIQYIQPYNVATSSLIGRDILTFNQVQKAIMISTLLGDATVLSPGKNSLYAFNSLYYGKESSQTYDQNIDNVYAILGFKLSPSQILKHIELPKFYVVEVLINSINVIPNNNNISTSFFDSIHMQNKSYTFNSQSVETKTIYTKNFFDYDLNFPIFILLLGFLFSYLFWYVIKTNVNFSLLLQAQNKVIESEVNEKTEQLEKQTKELKIAYENQLLATNELKSFSYSISHDLRSPLRSIDGFSRILYEDYADTLNEEAKQHLNRIINGTKRMGELIDSMLELALVAHKEIKHEQVSLSDFAHDIINNLKKQQPERDVDVVIANGLTINGDSALLHSVLENLLENAWKFTEKTTHAKIEFNLQSENNSESSYYVKDNGIGFDMNYADKLFTPFQRLHGKSFKGTGVGLATVERIIKRHRGKITVAARPNEGATFSFTLNNQC
ncbi:Phytochrome, two-component sensor histidine kinase [hydrothermal vent metagenome]|uniref:histidine kinase n=1 Tax=hydrothermal vent metagenome TaxID=652676 RepID=A0A3B1A8H5_9ZZZZ